MQQDFQTAKNHADVQQHVSPYDRIDASATGITADEVQTAMEGYIQQIYISVPGGGDVKVTSLDNRTTTVKFQDGVNPIPIKAVVQDPDNPTQVDVFY